MDVSSPPSSRHRGPWIAAACVCAAVSALALLPLLAELLSAFSGDHVWTLETVWFAVIPVAAIVVGWLLATSIRRARTRPAAVVRLLFSIAITVGGCLPLFILFVTLLNLTFRPAP